MNPRRPILEAFFYAFVDLKAAYHETKDAVIETGKEIYKGVKKGFQEAKEGGKDVAKDVKKGFKEDKAPETQKPAKDQ